MLGFRVPVSLGAVLLMVPGQPLAPEREARYRGRVGSRPGGWRPSLVELPSYPRLWCGVCGCGG